MDKYSKPEIKSYSASDLIELIGPTQSQYGSGTILGGRSAMLNNNKIAEYRYVKLNKNISTVTNREVSHA